MSENKTFALPDLGEGLTEADLSSWMVAVGDQVTLNQNIAEVETAKAAVELPSPYAGVVVELLAAEGDTVAVGSGIIVIAVASEAPTAPTSHASTPPSNVTATEADTAEKKVPVLVGYGVAGARVSKRRGRNGTSAAITDVPANGSNPPTALRARAKPPVRKLAREWGIDLAVVLGTGPDARVTRDDLLRHRESDSAKTAAPQANESTDMSPVASTPTVAASARETRVPIRGVRKHTAQAMVQSAFTAPHVTEFVTVDVTATMDLIGRLKSTAAFAETKLTPLAVISKILLVALRAHPTLNSAWDEQTQEIVTKNYVNLGIAAATPRGLMVPNIKDADRLGLRDLAVALRALTITAKDGKTSAADMTSGTITITNVGVFGVDSGTPILNPGEAAILCVGSVRKQPWVVDDEITIRSIMTLSLSFDHRLVDGQQGSQFLADIAAMLEDPVNLIALA
ncbi:dihydrolipoamide acetyltransferase family protein [Actinomycetes bacterium M1A6_2h]